MQLVVPDVCTIRASQPLTTTEELKLLDTTLENHDIQAKAAVKRLQQQYDLCMDATKNLAKPVSDVQNIIDKIAYPNCTGDEDSRPATV